MHRIALARRYRPRRFDELVGQDHVGSTLARAVESGRLAHAYLFSGPRGIGKTTAARILAMALNCDQQSGGEPCGKCDSCEHIWAGRMSLDVIEIDAASNRGVDDARDLRERAMYAPSDEGRYKVYILDEAHMLTSQAWNTLLKVLEEPPPRVIFAFATTEPQKIRQSAEPVLSRCQRFDFRRLPVEQMIVHLRAVLDREGVKAEEGALMSIARRAEGGIRDALSLLDQVLSFSNDSVELADVRRMLGLVEEDQYLELLRLCANGDRAAVFPYVQALVDAGYDLEEFVRGLGDSLRATLALKLDSQTDVAELTSDSRDLFIQAGEAFQETDLLRLLVAVSDFEAAGQFRRSAQPRTQVEVLLLRLASLDASAELTELLAAAGGPGAATSRTPAPTQTREQTSSSVARAPSAAPKAAPSPEPPGAEELRLAEQPAQGHVANGSASISRETWLAALDKARLAGVGVSLRGAEVESYSEGRVVLRAAPGLVEDLQGFLSDVTRSAALRLELARRVGLSADRLTFDVQPSGARARLTSEGAKQQQLSRMVAADPRLREAVEVLDLRIKE